MKRKIIYLSTFLILLTTLIISVICVNKNDNIIMQDGHMLALTLDGNPTSTFPNYNTGNYTVKITCNDGVKGKFLPIRESTNKEYKIFIEEINKKVKCNVEFKTKSNADLLKTKVETVGVNGTGSIVHETFEYNEETIDAGYRYEGQNPNNYVWFNNELWRIIGSIPIADNSDNRLIKIIRNQSIGGLAYDAKSNASDSEGKWGDNTLYTLLNTYYYGVSSRTKDATNTAYCYGLKNVAKAHCDYTEIGINSNSYYGQMVVENVLWNIGASTNDAYVNDVYITEKSTTTTGTIGLMAASDFGYATSASHTSRKLSEYDKTEYTLGNWLCGHGVERTNIQYSNFVNRALLVDNGGYVTDKEYSSAVYGYALRPTLFLNTEVYVVSGKGTISDPYRLAI